MQNIDIDRCLIAMQDLCVHGLCCTPMREAALASAIRMIQENPTGALKKGYVGIKNYASFGDQREDHEYGFGPRHGSIVFSIGRRKPQENITLGADHIYLLECVRDSMPIEVRREDPLRSNRNLKQTMNLTAAIERWDRYRRLSEAYGEAVSEQGVEAHGE